MTYEWDIYKAIANVLKHGISFRDAITALEDPWQLILTQPFLAHGEQRFKVIGAMHPDVTDRVHRVVVVIFANRQSGETRRLISARPASRRERGLYERTKKIVG